MSIKKNWQLSRRSILRGLGAAVALPWLNAMAPATARAAAATKASTIGATAANGAPVRLACMFHPNGVFPKAWNTTGQGKNYELSPILKTIAKHKDDFTVLANLENTYGKGHVGATGGFLTGTTMNNRVNAISVDQYVAQRIGHQTPFSSIVLGTEPPRQGGASGLPIAFVNTVSWASPTTRVSPEIHPQVAFDRMFRSDAGSKKKAGDTRSVLDIVLQDAKQLENKVGKANQHKLDEYFTGVREVEKRLERSLNPKARSWNPLTKPGASDMKRPGDGIPTSRGEHVDLMLDLMVLAFWTDTTRVSTFMMAHGFSRSNFTFMGVKGDHHTLSHHKNKESLTTDYTKVSQWYVSRLGYLMERLKKIDEGGNSLLDNTMILYGSGLKDGNGHKVTDLPILLAGGGGGQIKQGQRIECKPKTKLTNLHLSLIQRMGIDLDKFNTSTGTISELS